MPAPPTRHGIPTAPRIGPQKFPTNCVGSVPPDAIGVDLSRHPTTLALPRTIQGVSANALRRIRTTQQAKAAGLRRVANVLVLKRRHPEGTSRQKAARGRTV